MTRSPIAVDEGVVRTLLVEQFPAWSSLAIYKPTWSSWCNVTFRLGDELIVRLPREEAYAAAVQKEHQWLLKIAPLLSVAIPVPLALGVPSASFPHHWAIYRWTEGEVALPERVRDQVQFARDLASFLRALQNIDTTGGPIAGDHSFHRGGSLSVYDAQTREAIAILGNQIDTRTVNEVWDRALASRWGRKPVWLHGDVSVGNLLVREGRLCAVIDFGNMAIGDPACDLVMAWTSFEGEARDVFCTTLALDAETWARARAWALWKALILAAKLSESNAYEAAYPFKIIDAVLSDHKAIANRPMKKSVQ